MPWGRYPSRIRDFRKWTKEQELLGTIYNAHGKASSSQKSRRRRKRKVRNGSKD